MSADTNPNKLIVGLTGGIGSGKSLVSDMFSKKNIKIVDSDVVSRKVVEPGSRGLEKIVNRFGEEILDDNSFLDRKKLRKIIFSDQQEKKWLEELLHPLIREETISQLSTSFSAYSILSSPLLLETDTKLLTNLILVVDVSEDIQLNRATHRDRTTRDEIKKIINSQMDRKLRLEFADDVIDNSHSIEFTLNQVNKLHQKYLSFAEGKKRNHDC